MLRPTPGDPWGVEQHHWNTGANENQQLKPGGTCIHTNFSLQRRNSRQSITSFGIKCLREDLYLPIWYWIPKLHENLCKTQYIAGSAKYSTKPLSTALTKVLTAVKDDIQKYCATVYSRSGVSQMWILKIPKNFWIILNPCPSKKLTSLRRLIFQLSIPQYHMIN